MQKNKTNTKYLGAMKRSLLKQRFMIRMESQSKKNGTGSSGMKTRKG